MGEEEGKLSYSAEMDDSAFVRGMNNIRESVHETSATVQKTGMTVDNFSKSMNRFYGAADQNFAYYLSRLKDFDNETGKAAEEIKKTTTVAKELGEELKQTGNAADELSTRLTKAAAGYLSFQKAKEFIQAVATIRGEFQKLEVAFNTMLGSEERAQALLQQLTRTAAITPFDLRGVADGAKQLLAYGLAAEDVNDTLIHLGDIAAGLSIPLNDLVMLYGTTMTQGRMFTQDLRQFMGRGIPLADELAKQFGVTKDKVQELVTAGKVGAEEFNKAIMSMSSEGGKFAGLMEAQSETISGQISNIEDAIDVMFNNIGKSNEGITNDVLGSVSYLVENYEKVGEVLMGTVIAIGTYKTALITANAIEKASISIKQAMAVQEALLAAEARNLAAARGISIAAAKAELGSVNVLTVAKIRLTAATKALTASMMANPYTAVAAALAVVAVGVYKLATAEGVETAARRKANEEMQTFADKLDEQQNKIKGYIQTIQDETATEYQKAVAWEMLNKMAPTLTEKYDKAAMATLDLAEATKELNEQADKANYEHIRDEVQKWKETIDRINQNMLDDARYTGGKNALFNLQQLKGAEAQLDTYLKKLAEIDRIRAKMAEDAKPIEIRIKEANENVQAKQEIYDFYKRAADLAGELKNAHDEAAGVIANSGIPYNYEAIADQTKEKYDALIAELEADVEDLRTRIAESPASLELEQELKGKEKALDDLISMKQQWALSGATTIPLNFVMNFSQVETALQNAKNGQGINTQGMRFNGPTGTWVKDEATAPATMTASQWRKDAYNNWKQAQAAVDAFWNKKEEMDKATFDKEYKSLKDAADQAKKDYDKLKGSTNGNSSAARKAAETARKHQAYLDLIKKQRVEQERAVTDMEFSTEQATIDAMQDGAEKTLRQLKLDHEKRKEEIEREYADLKQAKIDAAKQLFEANPANKGKVFDASSVDTSYSEKEQANYRALMEANNATYRRALEDRQRMEAQAMLDYIKEYGSIQDQKEAITREYDEKIAEEGNTIQKAALQKQKEQLLAELNMKEVQQSIDWEVVFSNLDRMSTEALDELKEKLRKALDMKDITPENAKVLSEKILEIEDKISSKTSVWASMIPALRERERLARQTARSEEDAAIAMQKMSNALADLSMKRFNARDVIKQATGKVLTDAQLSLTKEEILKLLNLDANSEQYKKVSESLDKLAVSADNASHATQTYANAQKTAESWNKIFGGGGFFKNIGSIFKGAAGEGGFFGWLGLAQQNINSMAEFTDKIGLAGTDFGEAVHGFSEAVNGYMSAIQSLASGDVFGAVNGVIDGLAGFGKSLTAAFGINWSGGNAEEHDRKEEELIKANENLEVSINRLKESFDKANGMKAIETSQQIIKDMEQSNKNLMERWINDMGYHDAHHSNASNWEGFSNEQIRRMNEVLAAFGGHINGSGWEELTNLTPEALDAIREKLPDVWDFITSRGKYSWVYDSLNEYADQAGKIAEQEKALKENLTQLSETSLHDQFVSDLMDMEKSAEDFGNDFSEILMKAVLNAKIGNLLDDDLTAWRDELARRQEANGGTLTDADVEALRKMWDAIVEKGTEARDQLAAVTSYGKEAAEEAVLNIDSIRSAFADLISDTTQDVEEWAKNLTNTFINEFLQSQLLDDAFEERMNLWAKDFNDAWSKYQSGEWSEDVLNDFIYQLGREMDWEASQIREKAEKLKEALGYTFDEEQSESAFKDLRSSFLDTLLDMEGDAESFRKKLNETLVRDLIEKQVLDVPITINDTEFENFTAYAEDWNKRYEEAVKSGNQEAIDVLMEELVQVRELTVEAAEALRDKLRETKQDTTFKDMADSWISALMDTNKKAEDWAQDIGRTMAEKIIRELLVASAIQPMLDNLQNVWNEAFDGNGHDWQATLAAVKPLIDEMTEKFPELQEQAQGIMEAFGVSVEKAVEGFGDLRGTFVSALMDMEKDAEQFGRDIARAMTEQMVSALIEQQFSSQLAAINEAWFNALEAGDTAAMEKIRQQLIDLYSAIGDAVKPLLDSLAEIENVAEEEVDDTIIKMRDDFLSALMDMKAGTQDFVNDIRKLLTKKLVEKFVLNSAFDSWLEGIQHQYDDIFNGDMSEEQAAAAMNRLAAEWEAKAKEMQEQTQAIFDLTGWTAIVEQMNSPLADLRSSFVSALMDMESDAEDFADNISKILTEAFIDRFVLGEEFDKRLSEWQEQYAAIMKGNYSEEERALLLKNLQAAITAAKEGYAEEAQAIHDLMGTGNAKDQTATMNMADKATYDQFETYLGIAVAQQMATVQGNEVRLQILATLQAMTGITSPNGDTVKEIRTMLNTTNEYLLDIKRSNRSILNQFGERLDTIISRLQGLI